MASTASKSSLNLTPAAGYLLIEPLEAESKTASGIYLPDTVSEKPQKGKVLAVGADEITDSGAKKSSPAKLGDTVIYKKWGGNEVKVGTEEWLIVEQKDIMAVVS